MENKIFTNKHFFITVFCNFILILCLLTPVSAWTFGDKVCAGEISTSFSFDFDDQVTFDNWFNTVENTAVGTYEVVDGQLEINCVGTDANSFCQFHNYSINPIPLADVSELEIDMYMTGYSGLNYEDNVGVMVYLSYTNITEDLLYQNINHFFINQWTHGICWVNPYSTDNSPYCYEDITTLKMRASTQNSTGLWCVITNATTYEYLGEVLCPDYTVFDDISIQIHDATDTDADGWSINMTIDNLRVKDEENEYTSPDCAISYDDFSEIKWTAHFGNLAGVVVRQGYSEYYKYITTQVPEYIYGQFGTGNMIDKYGNTVQLFTEYQSLLENSISSEFIVGNLINVTCWIEWLQNNQNPPTYICIEFPYDPIWYEYQTINSATPIDLSEYSSSAVYVGDAGSSTGEQYVIVKYDTYEITKWRYYTRYNDTHVSYYDSLSDTTNIISKYYYYDLGYTPSAELVDEAWDYFGNFSTYRYYVIFDDDWGTINLYTSDREIEFEENEGLPIIVKGIALVNSEYNGYYGEIYNSITEFQTDNELSSVDYIGDGICGDLESDGYYTWNYDSQCRMNLASISNFAVGSTDISAIADFEDVDLVLNNTHGRINFTSTNLTQSTLDFDSNVEISLRHIGIDSSAMPELNAPAQLIFRNVGFAPPDGFIIYKDGSVCPTSICTRVSSDGETVVVDVTEFSDYDLIDSQGDLNLAALLDAIGGFFVAINETTSLSANAMASANSSDNIATLGGIIILFIIAGSLGAIWYIRR